MAKRGRKSKYTTNVEPNLHRIPKWRRNGMTEEQICKKLDVAVSTFANYKNEYLELVEALKKGKEELIEELEDSLYKKALGFEFQEEHQLIEQVGSKTKKKITKMTKYSTPDTGALAFALKNLAPHKWRDRKELEVSGQVNNPFEGLTTDELKKLINDG